MKSARIIVAMLPGRYRILAVISGLMRIAELSALYFAAVEVTTGAHVAAITLGGVVTLLTIARGIVQSFLLEQTRRTLFDAVAKALALADPLAGRDTEGSESETLVFGAVFEAVRLMSSIAPLLFGEIVAAALLTGWLATTNAAVLGGSLLLACVVAAALFFVVFRVTREGDQGEALALRSVGAGLTSLFRNRLEILASGYEREFLAQQAGRVHEWSRRAMRTAAVRALGGRSTLLASLLAAACVAIFGSESWRRTGTVDMATLRIGLVLGASVPAFTSALRNAVEFLRAARRLGPLQAALSAKPALVGKTPPEPMPPLPAPIRFRDVSFAYPGAPKACIEGLGLDWGPGRVLVVTGPNGSGKSTILRLLLALGRPTSGSIEVESTDLFSFDLGEWRRRIAFVPQRASFPDGLSVRDALAMTLPLTDESAWLEALDRVGLLQTLRARSSERPLSLAVSTLSAGEGQRLLLARALAAATPIVILDEPDTNLDEAGVDLLVELVRSRAVQSIAMAVHHQRLIALGDDFVRLGSAPVRLRTAATN